MISKIGFAKQDITPPVGTELGGYAGYRPCTGIHDSLSCRAVVLEQEGVRYGLAALDLMCVDEGLYLQIAELAAALEIPKERLIVCAIHSHAAPAGMIPGVGPLAKVNEPEEPKDPAFRDYMAEVAGKTVRALADAAQPLETYQIRVARGPVPPVGSERHTNEKAKGNLMAAEYRTCSGKRLIICDFPCHPTVLSAKNTLVSRDFVAGLEPLLGADMTVFLNGAAGDISTRFTRRESSFVECERMARIGAEAVRHALDQASFGPPLPLKGIHGTVAVQARKCESPDLALAKKKEAEDRVKAAEEENADPATLRILRSYVEGAGVNLQFARTMEGITRLALPVTVFRLGELEFATVPGELFSTLLPEGLTAITYANGYYRYIADAGAYDRGYYEALAAIADRGEGEKLMAAIREMLDQLK